MDGVTRATVVLRASNQCEYCHVHQLGYEALFQIDHIIALQHFGSDDLSNLALSSPKCNRKKGSNLSAIDPVTAAVVDLFNPRKMKWEDPFRYEGATAIGLSDVGRATISLLDLNHPERIKLRASLIAEGLL